MADNKHYKSNREAVRRAMTRASKGALEVVGEFITGRAVLLAPVDTSELKTHIFPRVNDEGTHLIVGTNVEYAIYVEYGTGIYAEEGKGRQTPWFYYYEGKNGKPGWRITRGQKPAKFLRRAFMDNTNKIGQLFEMAYQASMSKEKEES